MSQSPVRSLAAVALPLVLAIMAVATATADTRRILVRVYDTGTVDAGARAEAIRTAAAIIGHAGVDVEWHDCTQDGLAPSCQNSRRTGNLVVRIMPTIGSASTRGSAIEARVAEDADRELGLAIVDPGTRGGAMATLFHDQVETVARRTGVDPAELLGRALAHEIGHLLLGVTGHSPTGLMRAVWTDQELTSNRPEDWVFASPDRRLLRSRMK